MQHSLTHAPLFMHGEPEPSYSLRLFGDADRISLKEVEVMENLHREIALKRQAQQEDRTSRSYTCERKPYSSQSSILAAKFWKLGITPPQHDESPDELLIGAARRLDHIVGDRKASWRVVPTATNQQYPTSKYLYPKRESDTRDARHLLHKIACMQVVVVTLWTVLLLLQEHFF